MGKLGLDDSSQDAELVRREIIALVFGVDEQHQEPVLCRGPEVDDAHTAALSFPLRRPAHLPQTATAGNDGPGRGTVGQYGLQLSVIIIREELHDAPREDRRLDD
jgi:hypothetical protein